MLFKLWKKAEGKVYATRIVMRVEYVGSQEVSDVGASQYLISGCIAMCFSFLFPLYVNVFHPNDKSIDNRLDSLVSAAILGVVVAQYARFVFNRQSCACAEVIVRVESKSSSMRSSLLLIMNRYYLNCF